MAGCTIIDNSVTSPVLDAFSMSTTNPVTFLAKMTLPTKLVAVIIIDLSTLFVLKKITLFGMMAIYTTELVPLLAMVNNYVAVGQLLSVSGTHGLAGMTAGASKALNLIFSGQHPEGTTLVLFFGQYSFFSDRPNLSYRPIVKRNIAVFYKVDK